MRLLAISVDLGSTWTKGLLADTESATVIARRETPTTVDDLSRGFRNVWEPLMREAAGSGGTCETFLSSSAKGGLGIVAVGLVPELTAKAASLAAASAGGKVLGAWSYKLKDSDLRRIAASGCDLVLLAGGTDGGDEEHVIHNARALAASDIDAAFVYAGNSRTREEALAILEAGGKRAIGTENILPELDRLEIDGARSAVSALFLERIIEGRGLSRVRELCSADPRPTPAAVLDLVRLIHDGPASPSLQGGDGLLLVDLGGATTDVYSACESFQASGDRFYRFLRGIPEPVIKRTVEGDLGLRVSAPHVLAADSARLERALGAEGCEELALWADAVSRDTGRLGVSADEKERDAELASSCIALSVARHAGRLDPVYTSSGLAWVQTGKDLTSVRRVIGTGGYLSRTEGARSLRTAFGRLASEGDAAEGHASAEGHAAARAASGYGTTGKPPSRRLLPDGAGIAWYRDADYLIPLAANFALTYPEAARAIALGSLRPIETGDRP